MGNIGANSCAEQGIKEARERARALAPRIRDLIKIGNACIEAGVDIIGFSVDRSVVGFLKEKGRIKYVAFTGCTFVTDGEVADPGLTTDKEQVLIWMEQFLSGFDAFEERFYRYLNGASV